MSTRTRRATALAAVAAAALIAGCSAGAPVSPTATEQPADEQVTLTLVRTGTPEILRPIFEPILQQYEAQNPNVTIELQDLGWSDAATSISVMAASKSLPDVMYHLPGTVFDMADKGLVLDLTDRLSAGLKDDIFPALLAAGQYDGKQYLVPSGASSLLLWYNAELFKAAGLDPDQPPATWPELLAAADAIKNATGKPGLSMYSKPAGGETSFVFESLFASRIGGAAWDPAANEYLYSQPAHEAAATETLQFMQDLANRAQPNVVEYGRFDARTLFRDGEVGMALDLINMAAQVPDQLTDGTVRVAQLPAGEGGSISAINVGGWFVPTNSTHPEEAVKFLEFLMSTENQTAHTAYGSVPILRSEAATYSGDYWQTIIASLESGVPEGITPATGALWTVTGEQLQALLSSAQSPAETLTNINNGHREILGN